MKKVLITGASGYIGKNLCRKLMGDHTVFGTFLNSPSKIKNCDHVFKLNLCDKKRTEEVVREIEPDVIFHLAYDRNNLKKSVVDATKNLVYAWKNEAPSARFIYLSTDSVFDGSNPPYTEKDIPNPINEYGRVKLKGEKIVLENGGTVVRTALVYGIYPPDRNGEVLLKGLETGSFNFTYFKDEIRSPIYIERLTSYLEYFIYIENLNANIFHIAGDFPLSRYELAKKIARLYGFDNADIPASNQPKSLLRPLNLTFQSIYRYPL